MHPHIRDLRKRAPYEPHMSVTVRGGAGVVRFKRAVPASHGARGGALPALAHQGGARGGPHRALEAAKTALATHDAFLRELSAEPLSCCSAEAPPGARSVPRYRSERHAITAEGSLVPGALVAYEAHI